MGKIRFFLFGIAICGVIITGTMFPATASAQDVVIYCDNNYAPYSYAESGKAAGIYTEIFAKAFARMNGYAVTIKPVPWKRGVKLMEDGKGFALYPPYYRPKARPFMDYPVPVLDEGYSVLTSKAFAGGGSKTWPDDFAGKKIGINAGFSIPDVDKAKALGVKIEEAATSRSNLLKLVSGRLDGYISDKNAMLWELKQLRDKGEYDPATQELVIAGDISREQGYLGFTNQDKGAFSFKADFVKQFVAVINEMKAGGEIQAVLDAYIK
ncbi:MAG: transporter substrate-binding domain-containing protein [Desulfobacter sp.]|nr:MAG: transporter substrate-binding domain-containing protein [Desulfobacter sp.]